MIGETIIQVRKRLGLSQVALARELGMTKAQLCKIEKGSSNPRPETVSRLATALNLTTDELLAAEIRGRSLSPYLPIRKACVGLSEVCERVARNEHPLDQVEDERGVCVATTLPLVYAFLAQPHASEVLARTLRDALGVGTAAFSDLIWTLEFANVRIHRFVLPEGTLSASWWQSDRETLSVVLDQNETPERQLYRLAYELGAACLFRSCGNTAVAETKREHRFLAEFAADFLMPAAAIADMVAKVGIRRDTWTWRQLCLFKSHFGVSAEAFAFRLEELGLIMPSLRLRLRDNLRAYYKEHPEAMEPSPESQPHRLGGRCEILMSTREDGGMACHDGQTRGVNKKMARRTGPQSQNDFGI